MLPYGRSLKVVAAVPGREVRAAARRSGGRRGGHRPVAPPASTVDSQPPAVAPPGSTVDASATGRRPAAYPSGRRIPRMLQYLGIAWTAWKIGARRFGPAGGAVFALLAVGAVVALRDYLRENDPEAARRLEAAT